MLKALYAKTFIHVNLLEAELRSYLKKTCMEDVLKITGLKQSDISAWLNNKRNWSYNKILLISKKATK